MENLFYNISQVLGITIIHSLWQGLIIYMLLRMYLQSFPSTSSVLKYKIAYISLMAMLGWFALTLYTEVSRYNWHPPANAIATLPEALRELTAPDSRYSFIFAGYMPYVTMLYFAGLVFNTLKLMLAWNNSYRIRQNVLPAGFEDQVNRLSVKLGLKKHVQVGFSQWVDVPCITGCLKPIILLPFTIGNYLNADEIAVILLHELAHVRRNDYLLNIIQQAVGILLFFNPFARLTGKLINQERENCCDDAVIHVTGSPLIYARALLKLEENKQQQWHLSLAAKNKSFDLLNRIERIMKTKKTSVNIRPALLAVVLLGCSLSCLAWLNPKIEHGKVTVKATVPSPIVHLLQDTTRKSSKTKPYLATPRKDLNSGNIVSGIDTINDTHLQELRSKVEMHGHNIDNYFNSEAAKKAQQDLMKQDSDFRAFFENPKMKQWEKELEKHGHELDKLGNSAEMKQWQVKMDEVAKKMDKLYADGKMDEHQKELDKASAKLEKLNPNSPEFAKQAKKVAELSTYYARVMAKPEYELEKQRTALSDELSKFYGSPAFKAHNQAIKAFSDSIAAYTDNAEFKAKTKDIAEKFKDKFWNADMKNEMKDLEKSTKELKDYMQQKGYDKTDLKFDFKNDMHVSFDDNDTVKAPRPPKPPKAPKKADVAKPKKNLPPPPPPAAPKKSESPMIPPPPPAVPKTPAQ
ncbi:beta-lactamase regulating signal transducer with metallopeptidase domain [Mucilaginibacter yixingensis]|uniref:Beta-lactamase regulating signal transducer with metallopeptidase domain n=1 Tax=Mucilaginibacter yixingensis TaxID=1295612 RepID=A0A2T5JAX6_9SPHI|nr:M56 family metallopeptidase [Mucilaginibacter yixingensis]PTQ98020.1 beta-lactamase regulating signal transducer with metallopeptidase domain [Mucilaginibacter yixingensis]